MDFCCRSAAQSDQVGSKLQGSNWSESNLRSAKLARHILSNGQDELRILVEKAEYEAKSCFFYFGKIFTEIQGFFMIFPDSLGLIFQEMKR